MVKKSPFIMSADAVLSRMVNGSDISYILGQMIGDLGNALFDSWPPGQNLSDSSLLFPDSSQVPSFNNFFPFHVNPE